MERLHEEFQTAVGDTEQLSREQTRKRTYLARIVKESMHPTPSNRLEVCSYIPVKSPGLPTNPLEIFVRPTTRRYYLGVVDSMAQHPYSCERGKSSSSLKNVNSRRKDGSGLDADDFCPERWREQDNSNPYGWAYFPFNGGPRACLGQDFALMEVSYTIVRLLQAFTTIRLPSGEKNEPVGTERQRLTLVLSSADGCRVELVKRAKLDS